MSLMTRRTLPALIAASLSLGLPGLGAAASPPPSTAAEAPSAIDPTTSASSTSPLASSGCGTEQTPGNDERSITSAGGERTYRINIPRDYEADTPLPLILGFHGNGSDGAEFQNYTGLPTLPAITVFPDGTENKGKRSWQPAPYASGADDVKFVSDLLDSIESEHCIDLSRVFATGKSNGGGMVSLLACSLRERFSAFAVVAGAYYPQSSAGCDYSIPTPILAIHGTGDATMKYEGGTRQGETYPGVREWIQPWAEASECASKKERQVGRRGEKVLRTSWSKCSQTGTRTDAGGSGRWTPDHPAKSHGQKAPAQVELYSVTEGGHVWPGEVVYSGGGYATKDFSATDTVWRFFQTHPGTTTPPAHSNEK